jgi:ankyrin repeat protein
LNAAFNGHEEVLKLLLAHGAKTDGVDGNNETALQIAKKRQKIGCVKILQK